MLTIPTTATTRPADPEFGNLIRHHQAASAGSVLMLGANVAIGAEAARLRAIFQPKHGSSKRFAASKSNSVALGSETPWRDLVKARSGVSHEHCRRAEKVATDLRMALDGKRDKDSVAARKLLDDPTSITDWDHYALLARVVGTCYDADTWHGILVETGIVRSALTGGPNPGSPAKESTPTRANLLEEARLAALAYIEALRKPREHRDKWRKRLAVLPVDPTGDPKQPSLFDLYTEVKDQLVEIEEFIAKKRKC